MLIQMKKQMPPKNLKNDVHMLIRSCMLKLLELNCQEVNVRHHNSTNYLRTTIIFNKVVT